MSKTFIIAEAGSSHDNDLAKAYRLIEAAKECGADAVKFQWTSDPFKMAKRRGVPRVEETGHMYKSYLAKPVSWLESLKAHCDSVGIEFMCTVYLIEDIATIAPLVKRFKVSAFECQWLEFLNAHRTYAGRNDTHSKWKQLIASLNPGKQIPPPEWDVLHCVSEYPTPLERLKLSQSEIGPDHWKAGLSDHTTSTLTGALAVAAGATIVEKHIRLPDTDKSNPDYGHSLIATPLDEPRYSEKDYGFSTYVRNIREAERCM